MDHIPLTASTPVSCGGPLAGDVGADIATGLGATSPAPWSWQKLARVRGPCRMDGETGLSEAGPSGDQAIRKTVFRLS